MRSDILPYLRSKNSPLYKAYYVITSPARYIKKKIRPGGIKGSIFNLICGVLGTGMLTLPVVIQLNGIVVGSNLIILGALLTIFCGMWIVICSEITDSDSLEYIAQMAFGEYVGKLTSYSMLMCLLGYVTSYIVVVKTLTPYLIDRLFQEHIPLFMQNDQLMRIIVATVYSIFFLLPLSLPRKMGALRFTSLFGFACWIFLVIVITMIFLTSRVVVPDPMYNLQSASYVKVSFSGIFSSFPFIISSYMYQPMIPAIYKNLENRNLKRMEKVVLRGSYGAVFLYVLIAVFGYLTFAGNEEQLQILEVKQNILELDFKKNFYFELAIVCLILTIMTAGPLW
jgi:amino acid permease